MRINSSIAASAHVAENQGEASTGGQADARAGSDRVNTSGVAASRIQGDRGFAPPSHAEAAANLPQAASSLASAFAALGQPLFHVRAAGLRDAAAAETAKSGAGGASDPRQVAQRHGIIVIGGKSHAAAAAPALEGVKQGPMLNGIIIVGGSDPGLEKLGNFEIQRIMAALNQAETLAANVQKKADDAMSSTAGKIG